MTARLTRLLARCVRWRRRRFEEKARDWFLAETEHLLEAAQTPDRKDAHARQRP
jgi:hypothetical protein